MQSYILTSFRPRTEDLDSLAFSWGGGEGSAEEGMVEDL